MAKSLAAEAGGATSRSSRRSGQDRAAHAHHCSGRPASSRAHCGHRLRQLHGLSGHVPRYPRRRRPCLHPGVPVGLGHRARRGRRPSGPPHGRGPRRWRRLDGRKRTGDGGPLRPVLCWSSFTTTRSNGYEAATVRTPEDLARRALACRARTAPMLIGAKVTAGKPSWWLEKAFKDH
jgi:hypothetical protein